MSLTNRSERSRTDGYATSVLGSWSLTALDTEYQILVAPEADWFQAPEMDWFHVLCDNLPRDPEEKVWTDGDDILCSTEDGAETLADMIELLYKAQGEGVVVCTGHYDPAEDECNCEVNDHTGWYYLHID